MGSWPYIRTHWTPISFREIRESYNPKIAREVLLGLKMLLEVGKPSDEVCNLIMLTNKQSLEDVNTTMVTMYKEYGIRTCLMSLKPVDERGALSDLIPKAEDVRRAFHLRDELFLNGRAMGCMDFTKECCGTCVFVSLDGYVSSCYSIRRSVGSIKGRAPRGHNKVCLDPAVVHRVQEIDGGERAYELRYGPMLGMPGERTIFWCGCIFQGPIERCS